MEQEQMQEQKTRKQSNLDFNLMSLTYKLRDFRLPRIEILSEVGIKTGNVALDYGCGPGSYIVPLAKLVGEAGKIYALDIKPIAIEKVRKIALKNRLENVNTILTDCETGLQPGSVDVVLLYDILHDLDDNKKILQELSRILKKDGILSVSDHHLKQERILSVINDSGFFKLSIAGKYTISFLRK